MKTTNNSKPIIPEVFSMEISLSAIASSTQRIAIALDGLLNTTKIIADNSPKADTSEIETQLRNISNALPDCDREMRGINRSLERLPPNWDALDGIHLALHALLDQVETKARR